MKLEDHNIIIPKVYIHKADNDTIVRVKQGVKDNFEDNLLPTCYFIFDLG